MDKGGRPARQKIAGILDVFQDYLTRQGGKSTGQTAFNACEYSFYETGLPRSRGGAAKNRSGDAAPG